MHSVAQDCVKSRQFTSIKEGNLASTSVMNLLSSSMSMAMFSEMLGR